MAARRAVTAGASSTRAWSSVRPTRGCNNINTTMTPQTPRCPLVLARVQPANSSGILGLPCCCTARSLAFLVVLLLQGPVGVGRVDGPCALARGAADGAPSTRALTPALALRAASLRPRAPRFMQPFFVWAVLTTAFFPSSSLPVLSSPALLSPSGAREGLDFQAIQVRCATSCYIIKFFQITTIF